MHATMAFAQSLAHYVFRTSVHSTKFHLLQFHSQGQVNGVKVERLPLLSDVYRTRLGCVSDQLIESLYADIRFIV